jgi:pyocin large subunit-like protein
MESQKLKTLLKTVLFLTALAALAYYFNKPQAIDQPTQRESRIEQRTKRSNSNIERHRVNDAIGFASREKLEQHYRKHGAEFGDISMEEYLRHAQHLRDRPAGGSVIEYVRDNGIASRFDRETGTFIAFNRDKTIRTCFKPNDGEAYFHRQKNKEH